MGPLPFGQFGGNQTRKSRDVRRPAAQCQVVDHLVTPHRDFRDLSIGSLDLVEQLPTEAHPGTRPSWSDSDDVRLDRHVCWIDLQAAVGQSITYSGPIWSSQPPDVSRISKLARFYRPVTNR
jgi:hypothetical protein